MHHSDQDTIAAIATPLGDGGVAVIRLSGAKARLIAQGCFSKDIFRLESHHLVYGAILDEGGMAIDRVMVVVMLNGRSYTGEETVEIFCHGGRIITQSVVSRLLQLGARQALPGEFTRRAFLKGKIDLAQAEAVQQLIAAKSERALIRARDQLEGKLSRSIEEMQKELFSLAAEVEAWIDFPDELLQPEAAEPLRKRFEEAIARMEKLKGSYVRGKMAAKGVAVSLLGAPNAGKSSLLNLLLDQERAIVSPQPGTTRDLIEGSLILSGMEITLIDTAGLRASDELIEREGIRRAWKSAEESEIILYLIDANDREGGVQQLSTMAFPPEKTIVLWNKCDLLDSPPPIDLLPFPRQLAISVVEKRGVDLLLDQLEKLIFTLHPPEEEGAVITSLRHLQLVEEAIDACRRGERSFSAYFQPELAAADLKEALRSLGAVVGNDVGEGLLDAIFSQFCIGK